MLAITEKVVIKLEDLLTWITEATDWSWGLDSIWRQQCNADSDLPSLNGSQNVNGDHKRTDRTVSESISENSLTLVDCSAIDYTDIKEEKAQLGTYCNALSKFIFDKLSFCLHYRQIELVYSHRRDSPQLCKVLPLPRITEAFGRCS